MSNNLFCFLYHKFMPVGFLGDVSPRQSTCLIVQPVVQLIARMAAQLIAQLIAQHSTTVRKPDAQLQPWNCFLTIPSTSGKIRKSLHNFMSDRKCLASVGKCLKIQLWPKEKPMALSIPTDQMHNMGRSMTWKISPSSEQGRIQLCSTGFAMHEGAVLHRFSNTSAHPPKYLKTDCT